MWQFFKYLLASILALFIFFGFSLFLLIGIISISGGQTKMSLSEPAVLKLDFDEAIYEVGVEDPLEGLDIPFASVERGIGLNQIKESIRNATLDPNIKAIYIESTGFGGGMAMLEEVRNELRLFKESGKPIIAYSAYFTEMGYYLFSISDRIFLHPSGGMEFNGVAYERIYFKGTMDKLDIKPEIFRVGEYKSAIEPFIREDMSPASRLQEKELLAGIKKHYLDTVSASRMVSYEILDSASNNMIAGLPRGSKKVGLIDEIGYESDAMDYLKTEIGLEEEELKLLSVRAYQDYEKFVEKADTRDRIAIVVAEGEIRQGDSEEGIVGSETIKDELNRLKDQEKVKAIVLRVNSPGGGGLASDDIWKTIQEVREEKPVVASMSDLAASGGYYLSMGCDYIYAQPNTITGSIGVFGLFLDMTDFFKNKLGITRDVEKTGKYADIFSPLHHFTDGERQILQSYADDFYDNFITKAAEGRSMDKNELDKLAGGRVWAGRDAVRLGLVDELGGLEEALIKAAELAGIDTYKTYYYPKRKSFFEELFEDMGTSTNLAGLKSELGPLWTLIIQSEDVKNFEGLWARMPFGTQINY